MSPEPIDPDGRATRRRRRPWASVVLGVTVLMVSATVGPGGASAAAPTRAGSMVGFDSHIDHIVFIMMENHPYDNYFGEYCLALSKYCRATGDGIPAGTCVPMYPTAPTAGCIRPFNFTPAQLSTPDLNHDWGSTHSAYDNGAMDGFYQAEGLTPLPYGHYNGSTVPVYWDLAEQYGLADDFFSSAASYSLPNHWFLVSSNAPSIIEQNFPGASGVALQHTYLNESNASPALEDQLVNSSVSWKYYQFGLPSYTTATNPQPLSVAWNLWNPLASRAQSYAAKVKSHFVASSTFATDAGAGNLPNISWLIPPELYSDHPPYNVTAGQTWVASELDAIEGSPEWNSTVVFLSWDEYGGYYDHVRPPTLDSVGDGFRVPLLAIGPYVKQGAIDHAGMNFGSVLHLMEKRFGLKCMGARDCNATLPLAFFDFNRSPRAPITIPGYSNASYPMPLQSSGNLPPFNASQGPVLPRAPPAPGTTVVFADGGIG